MKRFFIAAVALAVSIFMAAPVSAQTPLPNDPEVRVGHLDNGLTYYIRHNALPEHRAEFYLATNVGAIQEEYPCQDGLAHFLEHMCFNGTEHFPDKGILDYLRSIGAEFGRNINASTGVEETQYMLNNIPVERESVVDSCLMILCDYAHFVINDPAEVDKERGVIIEERRQRRNASWRMHEASLPYYYGDSKYGYTTLIGLQEHLEGFDAADLVRFYRTWYHPDMQAVIVVGDIDVDRTEGKIKEIFSVIPKEENPKAKDVIKIPDNEEPIVGVITDPEATAPTIEMLWKSEPLPEELNNTDLALSLRLMKNIIGLVMEERFEDITADPESPFTQAEFGIFGLTETCEAVIADVVLKEENMMAGFEAFYTELLKMQKYGFADDEVERAVTNILNMYENRVKKADTRKNPEFVRPLISNFFDNTPYMDPETENEIVKMVAPMLTAQVLNQVVPTLLTKENLIVLYKGPEKEGIATPKEADILASIAKVQASDIKPNEGGEIASEFLDKALLKGAAVKKESKVMHGATEWILKNGVRVIALPTDYTKNQILFDLWKDGGLSLVEDKDIDSFDDNVFGLYNNNSGISKFSGTEVSKMLTGKTLSVSPYISDLESGVSGNSTPKDLETAMQLIYLYFTDPRFDPKEYDNGINQLKTFLPNLENQPNYKFAKRLYKDIYGDNVRRQQLSMETLEKANLATLEREYRKLFKDAAGLTMVIVGDFDLAELKPLVEKYIGSLPKGKKATPWIDRGIDIVKGIHSDVFEDVMQTPQSTVFQVWSCDKKWTAEDHAALDAAKYILDMRYVNSLREDEGGTYGAGVNAAFPREPKEKMMMQVSFNCKPAVTDRLRELAVEGIRDLGEKGPTDDEVNAAILNLKKNIPENRVNNSYWRRNLEEYVKYGINYDALTEAAINGLTAERVKNIVAELISAGNFYEVVQKPTADSAEAE